MTKPPKSTEDQLRLITGSSLDLSMKCQHWVTLPLTERAPGRPAVMGTAFHSLVSDGCHEEDLTEHEEALVQARFEGWVREYGASVLSPEVRQEIAFCLEPNSLARELLTHGHRDYGDALGICGTLDLIFPDRVADLKTGHHPPASEAWQLRFGAIVSGKRIGEFHAVDERGHVKVDRVEYTDSELVGWTLGLVALQAIVLEGRTFPRPGPHCDQNYCRARSKCPAYKRGASDDESGEY